MYWWSDWQKRSREANTLRKSRIAVIQTMTFLDFVSFLFNLKVIDQSYV